MTTWHDQLLQLQKCQKEFKCKADYMCGLKNCKSIVRNILQAKQKEQKEQLKHADQKLKATSSIEEKTIIQRHIEDLTKSQIHIANVLKSDMNDLNKLYKAVVF